MNFTLDVCTRRGREIARFAGIVGTITMPNRLPEDSLKKSKLFVLKFEKESLS